jgi:hypothetical protein
MRCLHRRFRSREIITRCCVQQSPKPVSYIDLAWHSRRLVRFPLLAGLRGRFLRGALLETLCTVDSGHSRSRLAFGLCGHRHRQCCRTKDRRPDVVTSLPTLPRSPTRIAILTCKWAINVRLFDSDEEADGPSLGGVLQGHHRKDPRQPP